MPTSYSRIKTVWQFAKRYVPFFIVAEICILVSYGAAVILPLNLSQLTDRVLIEGQHDMFVSVLLQFVLLFAISSAFNFIYAYTWQTLQNRYIVDVKNEIFRKTIFAKASFLSNMSSGDIMSRIDCDAEQFLHVIQRNLFHFVNSIIMCLSIVTIVGAIHIWLAVLLVVMAALPILLTRLCTKATEKYARETREITGNMTGRFYEILKGWREIHLHGAEEWAKSQMMTPFRRLIVLGNRLRRINFFVDKGIYFINLMTSLVIYGVSAVLIFQGQMTVGLFMAVIQYIALMHRKFNWMLRIYLDWYTRKSSIDRVHEILAADTEDDEGLEQITSIESIEFRQVSFAYEPQTPILQDVTFAINKGEHVGIAGASGAGKSSLLGLIMGFYQPSSGEIRINGIPQTKISPFAIRRLVGMVSQDIFVFRETIRYNLELGASYSEDELWAALKAVQLQEVIQNLPKGLDTVLGTAGSDLSGGQKQRLMLARLFLTKKPFFILDEATSALDMETEAQIVHQLASKAEPITMLVISHRPAAIRNCERILLLHEQTIEAVGSHDELMKSSLNYSALYRGAN